MKPAFVLGIDGLPYTLTHRLINEGVMPNLGQLIQQGQLSKLHVTVPDFSCVSWTSFYTGVNPGKHGIYGFQDFDPKSSAQYCPDSLSCKVAPLWHEVGNNGGRSIIINLPNTYPAQPLRGKMVSGFVAPELDKACYPSMFAQSLRSLDYKMDLDGNGGLGTPEHVRNALWPVFEARKNVIRHAIKNEYWDLCIAVLTETDRLQHYFLHTLHDSTHELNEWTLSFYKALDDFIGEVAEMLDGKADLYMVSDHGFDVVKHEIHLEPLLADLGLAPKGIHRPWEDPESAKQTKVFTLDPGRFYINRKDSRFPHGIVEEAEKAEILDKIRQALLELKDPANGKTMVNTVSLKEEGFWGDTLDYAPDMVAATNPGYYFKAFRYPKGGDVYETTWEANHVWNDAILYTPHSIIEDVQPVIWDVMPTVLSSMELTPPDIVDGKILF